MPKALEIYENIYWVGAVDWEVRDIHSNKTPYGTSYNAYLVVDDQDIMLIDTVDAEFSGEMISRIASVVDPKKITKVLSNHTETDHSGGLPAIMELAPNAELICSPKGEATIERHFHGNWNYTIVKTGDIIKTGKYEFTCLELPFVHWPETMGVYLASEKILFPNDAFGQHIGTSERFDHQGYPLDIVYREAKRYYANIVMAYNVPVAKVLPVIDKLEINMIAPSHGIIWTQKENIEQMKKFYTEWATQQTDGRAVIVYDTMAGSTKKIAYAIRDVLEEFGIEHRVCNLQSDSVSEVLTDVMTAKYVFIGSPTFNKTVLPNIGAFLSYIKGFAPLRRVGMAFGSYGWGAVSNTEIQTIMNMLDWDILHGCEINYVPTEEQLDEVRNKLRLELKERV